MRETELLFSRSTIGIFLTLLAACCGVGTGLIVKMIGDDLSLLAVLMYRFIFSVPLLVILGFAFRGRHFLQINQKGTLAVRIIIGCFAMACWFTSVRLLPLGQATALGQSSVIFVTVLSPMLLGELIGRYRWTAVIVGMLGIVLLTNPFDGGFSVNVIYGLVGAVAAAILTILLRRLGKSDHPLSVAVWYNGVGMILMIGIVALHPDQLFHVTRDQLVILVALGVVASCLQASMTTAFRFSDAVVISTLRYLQIPLAALVAFLMFNEILSPTEIAGGGIVIISCVVIAWRDFVRSRRAREITDAGT